MYLISQYGKLDCAFTCLSMMLANYHKDKNYLFLKHEDRSYNFKELITIGEQYNTKLIGVRIEDANELLKNKSWPIIVTLKGEKKTNHAVLLTKVTKKYAYYFDPCYGKRKVVFSDFVLKWTKLALIIGHITKTKCPKTSQIEVSKKDKNLLFCYQLFSGLGLLFGVYFLDKNFPLYISLICFVIFGMFEVLFRRYLIFALERIDDDIYNKKVNKPFDGYKEVFDTIQKFRYYALTTLPNLVYGMLVSVFIIVILAMNNFWNLSFVVASFALSLIESFVIKPIVTEKNNQIMEEEAKIITSDSDYDFQYFSRQASSRANKVGLLKVLVKYSEIIILLIFSYLMMRMTGLENVTYVIFNLCVSFFLISSFNSIFNYASQKDEFDYIKLKLNNYLESNDAK